MRTKSSCHVEEKVKKYVQDTGHGELRSKILQNVQDAVLKEKDFKMLGEMMFGSAPMTYKGQSLKVHEVK